VAADAVGGEDRQDVLVVGQLGLGVGGGGFTTKDTKDTKEP
jgi:hypothetical protein